MKIFISYRRSDDPGGTGRLFDHLEAKFGKGNVFIDVDSNMPLGVDFRKHIAAQVAQADIVLAVIGPNWLKLIQEKAEDPRDFVRAEIEAALQTGKPLVPVLMKSRMPNEEELPPSIARMAYLNGMPVDVGADFRHHTQRLCSKLESSLEQIRFAEEEAARLLDERKLAEEEARRREERRLSLEPERRQEEERKLAEDTTRRQPEIEHLAEEVRRPDEEPQRVTEEKAKRQEEVRGLALESAQA